jgi:urease accessory protein UreF
VAALERRLDDLLVELRLTRELLREQRAGESAQDARLDAVENAVDDLQQQILQHTVVTPAQQEAIKRAIRRVAARYQQRTGAERYAMLFAQFCKAMGTPRYDALPAHKYEQALDWVEAQARALLPDDPDALPPRQERLL